MAFWCFWPVPRMIFINKERSNESLKYLQGLLVHEVCHLALVEKRSFIKSAFRLLSYWIIPKLRRACPFLT